MEVAQDEACPGVTSRVPSASESKGKAGREEGRVPGAQTHAREDLSGSQ